MKRVMNLIIVVAALCLVGYLIVATGVHKSLYSFVKGEYARDVRPTYSPVVK